MLWAEYILVGKRPCLTRLSGLWCTTCYRHSWWLAGARAQEICWESMALVSGEVQIGEMRASELILPSLLEVPLKCKNCCSGDWGRAHLKKYPPKDLS